MPAWAARPRTSRTATHSASLLSFSLSARMLFSQARSLRYSISTLTALVPSESVTGGSTLLLSLLCFFGPSWAGVAVLAACLASLLASALRDPAGGGVRGS